MNERHVVRDGDDWVVVKKPGAERAGCYRVSREPDLEFGNVP